MTMLILPKPYLQPRIDCQDAGVLFGKRPVDVHYDLTQDGAEAPDSLSVAETLHSLRKVALDRE